MTPTFDQLEIIYAKVRATISPRVQRSKVFCMAPWIQLHAQTNGDVGPCCMANMEEGNAIANLNTNADIRAAWNAEAMMRLRQNMLKGKESAICKNCYAYEKVGRYSERTQYNSLYKAYYGRVLNTSPQGYVAEQSIPLIDIRFSNRCNYKCRICSSEYSSLWHEEELRLDPNAKPYPKGLKMAADENLFWQSFETLLPDVKRLHFAGGEPLVMDEHYRTLEHLISIGKTDLTLSYNTNLSTLNHKQHNLVALWNKFEKVDIWASLDGMDAKGDYQRKGQHWPTIVNNIRKIQLSCPVATIGVNVTVSILNILHVPDFYRHMVESGLVAPDRMNLYLLYYPHYLSVNNLTPNLKLRGNELYTAFIKDYAKKLDKGDNFINNAKAILNYMNEKEVDLKQEFGQHTAALDALRGESFATTFPELVEMNSAL
jgi:MoaA/NifB/PqqE/SkfB family radical SAM enzyme